MMMMVMMMAGTTLLPVRMSRAFRFAGLGAILTAKIGATTSATASASASASAAAAAAAAAAATTTTARAGRRRECRSYMTSTAGATAKRWGFIGLGQMGKSIRSPFLPQDPTKMMRWGF